MIHADITYKVRGALFTVFNELGFGHKEQVYQKALEKELKSLRILFKREEHLPVRFKDEMVGSYRQDFVVEEKVIVELKSVAAMVKNFEIQLLHYLKTTGFEVGLLVNFGNPRLYIKRLVASYPRKSANNPRESRM